MVEWEHPPVQVFDKVKGKRIEDIWIHFRPMNNIKIEGFTTNDFKICLHPIITDTAYCIKVV